MNTQVFASGTPIGDQLFPSYQSLLTVPFHNFVLLLMVINFETGQPFPKVAFAVNDHDGEAN